MAINGADFVRSEFLASAQTMQQVADALAQPTVDAAAKMAAALLAGNKILMFGNGGSAADAQHFAGEFVGRFKIHGRAPLPVLALNADSAVMTCIANDFSYDDLFSRQVEAFAQPGDVVFGISTSGRSENVLRGLQMARQRGAATIALVGKDGGPVGEAADIMICVPSQETARIQECHILIIHALSELMEGEYVEKTQK